MKICLSIGYPIKTSRSPLMHNAGYKKLKIDNEFIYLSAEVKPEDLKMAVDGVRVLGIRGVSVTMPLKLEVMKYLDKIENSAKIINAVNTIVNDNGKLTGFNTDWIGAQTALEKRTNLKGKRVALIGAGGAARALCYMLNKKGAITKIFNRTLDQAKKLASEFDCEFSGLNSLEQVSDMDIIINATSIGMNEDKSPLNKDFLKKGQLVFDIVYSPKITKLIKDAKEKGVQVILGYEMLLYQGVEQFKLFTGLNAPVEAMRKTLVKDLS